MHFTRLGNLGYNSMSFPFNLLDLKTLMKLSFVVVNKCLYVTNVKAKLTQKQLLWIQ